MQVSSIVIIKNKFLAVVSAKGNAESERLTKIRQDELTQTRADNLNAEIEKICSKRKYKGDRIVFRTDEEFARAGMSILKKIQCY